MKKLFSILALGAVMGDTIVRSEATMAFWRREATLRAIPAKHLIKLAKKYGAAHGVRAGGGGWIETDTGNTICHGWYLYGIRNTGGIASEFGELIDKLEVRNG